ncbi:MAG: HET-C-related protein [Bryobacteraceae bacterium]|nr:HET-C-related protein [Bryobacteraceae bacterium]
MLPHSVFLCRMLLIALALPASGFKVPIHRQITVQALAQASVKFNELATAEIINANECVDGGPVEAFTPAENNKPCIPNLISVDQQLGAPEDHFDDEQFLTGGARLRALKMQIELMVNEGKYVQARKLLGAATHTLQDFYSHSNWVELGKTDIFADIEDMRRLVTFQFTPEDEQLPASGPPKPLRLAAEDEDVCEFSWVEDRQGTTVQQRKVVSPSKLLPKARGYGHVLTSGMFFNVSKANPKVAKCNHGAIFDGIQKDDSGSDHGKVYHSVARALALKHTRLYIEDVLAKFRGNKKALLGLTTGIAVVSANTVNPTFVEVRAGEQYRFITPAEQRINWGYEGGLFQSGRVFTAGPEGVNANGLARTGLIPPPLRQHGVGALIGLIKAPASCFIELPKFDGDTGKPCPDQYVYIGLKPIVEMPISGTLFLQVNDGVLGNNAGEFITEFTLSKAAPKP